VRTEQSFMFNLKPDKSSQIRVSVMVFNATSAIFQLYHVSFICGGNLSTWRKPLTCHKWGTYKVRNEIETKFVGKQTRLELSCG
jgi:hypothetical protein